MDICGSFSKFIGKIRDITQNLTGFNILTTFAPDDPVFYQY
jgi:hypothetical protein